MDNANTHGVEANIKRFLEAAKMLESDFLRKQMYSRVNHPEEVTKEEVEKMRAELAQKDELLTKTRDRITVWTNALQELETKLTRLHLADMVPQRPASMDSTRQLNKKHEMFCRKDESCKDMNISICMSSYVVVT